jgi:2,4-dienoyl-CoA reductase-like NADH-dependent reductase (Old Yellow Enzyme family)
MAFGKLFEPIKIGSTELENRAREQVCDGPVQFSVYGLDGTGD